MSAEQIGGKLLLELLPADAAQLPVNPVTGVIEQAVQAIAGQRDDLCGGALDALLIVQIKLNGFETLLLKILKSCALRQAASTR